MIGWWVIMGFCWLGAALNIALLMGEVEQKQRSAAWMAGPRALAIVTNLAASLYIWAYAPWPTP